MMLEPYTAILDAPAPPAADQMTAQRLPDPIAIGAVGGSGTRLLANMLRATGICMGTPLNKAGDALEWPPMAKLLAAPALNAMDRTSALALVLHAFESLMLVTQEKEGMQGRAGWKVPGTFHWLGELSAYFSGLQYIHIIRHGLDMAYSNNRNQAQNWAATFDLELRYTDTGKVHPHSQMEYWLLANERAVSYGQKYLGDRFLLVRFEDLCERPAEAITRLFAFLQQPLSDATAATLASMVEAPSSIGRYRQQPWREHITASQLERLERLGYSTDAD